MNKERTVPVKASQSVLDWKDFTDERLLLTLCKLQQLNTYAPQHRIELCQLAVPISDFREWGHRYTELRFFIMLFTTLEKPAQGSWKLESSNKLAPIR
jgi:hypothetical protein